MGLIVGHLRGAVFKGRRNIPLWPVLPTRWLSFLRDRGPSAALFDADDPRSR